MLTLAAGPRPAIAAPLPEGPSHIVRRDERVDFKIPSQPLADALHAYSAATGVEVLVAGELLSGRRSAEIQGVFAAEDALQALLAGTGLVARFMDSGAFTLTPVQVRTVSAPPIEAPSDIPRYARYSAMVQEAVKRLLCRQAETRPGYYRVALQIWIAPSGTVDRSILVGTTGDAARDTALSNLFNGLTIGEPPPAGLPQPATLLILPRSPQQTADCASVDRSSRP